MTAARVHALNDPYAHGAVSWMLSAAEDDLGNTRWPLVTRLNAHTYLRYLCNYFHSLESQ